MALIANELDAETQTLRLLQDDATGFFNHGCAAFENMYRLVWNNPRGLSPQQVLNLLGVEAAKLFVLSYKLGELLNEAGAKINNAVPEGVTYVANADGTVTITSG